MKSHGMVLLLVGGSMYPMELVEVCPSWPEYHGYKKNGCLNSSIVD